MYEVFETFSNNTCSDSTTHDKMSGLQYLISHYSKQGVDSQRKENNPHCLVIISLKTQFVIRLGLKTCLQKLDKNMLYDGY